MRVSPKVPVPRTHRVPNDFAGVTDYERWCAEQLESMILAEGPESVPAFILEPMGGVSTGVVVSSEAYHQRVSCSSGAPSEAPTAISC